MKILCLLCEDGQHTEPGQGSEACTCGLRTCACYAVQVRLGVRKDKSQNKS